MDQKTKRRWGELAVLSGGVQRLPLDEAAERAWERVLDLLGCDPDLRDLTEAEAFEEYVSFLESGPPRGDASADPRMRERFAGLTEYELEVLRRFFLERIENDRDDTDRQRQKGRSSS